MTSHSIALCLPISLSLYYFFFFFHSLFFSFEYVISGLSKTLQLCCCCHHVYKSVKLSLDHHLLGRYLVVVFLFFLSLLLLSVAHIYPTLSPSEPNRLVLNSICMTRYFPAPHNEERDEFVYAIYQLIHQTQFGLVFIFGMDLLSLSISVLLPLSHILMHINLSLSLTHSL